MRRTLCCVPTYTRNTIFFYSVEYGHWRLNVSSFSKPNFWVPLCCAPMPKNDFSIATRHKVCLSSPFPPLFLFSFLGAWKSPQLPFHELLARASACSQQIRKCGLSTFPPKTAFLHAFIGRDTNCCNKGFERFDFTAFLPGFFTLHCMAGDLPEAYVPFSPVAKSHLHLELKMQEIAYFLDRLGLVTSFPSSHCLIPLSIGQLPDNCHQQSLNTHYC